MTEEQPKQFGIDLQSIAIPIIVALVLVYLIFPQYNDSELRQQNTNLTARVDIIEQTKADANSTDSRISNLTTTYGTIGSEVSLLSHDSILYDSRLNNSESKILQCEQNMSGLNSALASGLAAADERLNSKVAGLQDTDSRFMANMTEVQAAVNSIVANQSNHSEAIYTLIVIQQAQGQNITSMWQNMTAMNMTMQNWTRVYAILCSYNSSWC